MLLGILGPDEPRLHQPADIGVVASQAGDARTAHQIKAAISDVRIIKLAIADYERGAGGPHTVQLRVLGWVSLHPFVSPGKCLEQSEIRVVAGWVGKRTCA